MTKKKDSDRVEFPLSTKCIIWGRAAGRCQFAGCNRHLTISRETNRNSGNYGQIAHIYGASEGGPRGRGGLSNEELEDPSNGMLLCYDHHKAADEKDGIFYSASELIQMKSDHENMVDMVMNLTDAQRVQILHYTAEIGKNTPTIDPVLSKNAVLSKGLFPIDVRPIEIKIEGLPYRDSEKNFWEIQSHALEAAYKEKITHDNKLAIFAIAPQPLLIKLGALIGEVRAPAVFQALRDPASWQWQDAEAQLEFTTREGVGSGNTVALKIELSANISDQRVQSVLGDDIPIWSVSVPEPNNNVLRAEADLFQYRRKLHEAFSSIRENHPDCKKIAIFPAMPVSAAVTTGLAWMPKADLPLEVYDQNNELNGFEFALSIG